MKTAFLISRQHLKNGLRKSAISDGCHHLFTIWIVYCFIHLYNCYYIVFYPADFSLYIFSIHFNDSVGGARYTVKRETDTPRIHYNFSIQESDKGFMY